MIFKTCASTKAIVSEIRSVQILIDKVLRPEVVALMAGTVAVESNMGQHRRQIGYPYFPESSLAGAFGITQMEIATAQDIFRNYLTYRKPLWNQLADLWLSVKPPFFIPDSNQLAYQLMYDDTFSLAMMRIHYRRDRQVIPKDLEGIAKAWKSWYNTHLGRGTVEKFIEAFKRHNLEYLLEDTR